METPVDRRKFQVQRKLKALRKSKVKNLGTPSDWGLDGPCCGKRKQRFRGLGRGGRRAPSD